MLFLTYSCPYHAGWVNLTLSPLILRHILWLLATQHTQYNGRVYLKQRWCLRLSYDGEQSGESSIPKESTLYW